MVNSSDWKYKTEFTGNIKSSKEKIICHTGLNKREYMGGGRVLYVRYYAYLAVEGGQEPTECPGEDKSPRNKKRRLCHKVRPCCQLLLDMHKKLKELHVYEIIYGTPIEKKSTTILLPDSP